MKNKTKADLGAVTYLAGRQTACIQELPDPSEAEVISKTSACVKPLSLWGVGKAPTGDREAVE